MKTILKISVYCVAPIMVVLTTLIIKFFPIKNVYLFVFVILLSFFLLLVLVEKFNNQNNKRTQLEKLKFLDLFSKENVKKVLIYMFCALVAGTLFDLSSRLIVPNEFNLNDVIKNILLLNVILVFLFTTDFKINSDVWLLNSKYTYLLLFFILLTVLQTVSNITESGYQKYIFNLHVLSLFIYSIYVFHLVVRVITRPVNCFKKGAKFSPKEHIIMFLSVLHSKRDLNYWCDLTQAINEKDSLIKLSDKIMKEYKTFHHPWEMNLRSIAYHLEPDTKLKQITLLASSEQVKLKDTDEKQSSMEQVKVFLSFLKKYLQKNNLDDKVKIRLLFKKGNEYLIDEPVYSTEFDRCQNQGVDFNDFDEIFDALTFVIKHSKDNGIKYSESVIDFTGGQKITSAAATLMATSYSVRNQYVNTNHPKNVVGYNFVYENPINTI